MGEVLFEPAGPFVSRAVVSNPGRGNALTPEMMLRLAEALRAASESGARVVVVAGGPGRAFCSGYDLRALPAGAGGGSGDWRDRFPELTALLVALEDFPGATVAEVGGAAIGGGALLAAACDLRVASPSASFRIPATRLGVLYPLEGIRRLVGLVGLARATDLLLTGRDLPAAEAAAWGLFGEVVEADRLAARAAELAATLAARAPLAVRGLRAVLRADALGTADAAVRSLHSEWTGRCIASRDLAEGLAAAAQRREPRFEGR